MPAPQARDIAALQKKAEGNGPLTTEEAQRITGRADSMIAKIAPQMDLKIGGGTGQGEGLRMSGTVGVVIMMGLLSMLPVGGAAFVWIPAVIWLLFDGRWGFAVFMLAWGVLLGGLDNVLRPMLISGRAKISALAVFIGVLGGIPAFGAIGLIAGPVVLSLALALIEFAEESRAQRS